MGLAVLATCFGESFLKRSQLTSGTGYEKSSAKTA
jgi:hypothetical protein